MANTHRKTVANHQARKQANLLLRHPTNNAATQRQYAWYHSEMKELLITSGKTRGLGVPHGVTQRIVWAMESNVPHRIGPCVHRVLQHSAAGH